jgi:orotate phosphoribosyltransferase
MKDIVKILKNFGAIIENSHFVGVSGKHLPTYLNKDALLMHTKQTSMVGKLFAEKSKNKNIEVVISPAVAGIPFSQWTAHHLSKITGKEVLSVFTEKTIDNDQVFKRGYDKVVKGKRVLVVEDSTTTGSSVKKVIHRVKKAGGKVVSVCVMLNRNTKLVNSKTVGAPFSSLGIFNVPTYDPKNCPLCKSGVPVNTQFGHGKKFLQEKKRK